MNENEKMIVQLVSDMSFIKAKLIGDVDTLKEDVKNIESKLEKESEKVSEILMLKERVSKLESIITWASRGIVGAVVVAILGVLFTIK